MDIEIRLPLLLATFLSQLLILSLIAPRRARRYRRALLERYPPTEYPRLHPLPVATLERQRSRADMLGLLVGCGGLIALIVVMLQSGSTRDIASCLMAVAVAQLIPPLVRWPTEYSLYVAQRRMEPPPVRTVELRQWMLRDFVSMPVVTVGVISVSFGLLVAAYLLTTGRGVGAFNLLIVVANLALLARMLRLTAKPLAIPRQDPYATTADVYAMRKRRLRALFVGASVFAIVTTIELLVGARVIAWRYEYLAIGVSLVIQATALRVSSTLLAQLHDRDFSVYRSVAQS